MECYHVLVYAITSFAPLKGKERTGTWIPPDTASWCVSAASEVLWSSAVQMQLNLTDGVSCLGSGLKASQAALINTAQPWLFLQILGVILLINAHSLFYPTLQ